MGQPRNRRGAQKVAKPLPEKKEQIQAYFQQYNHPKEDSGNSLVNQSEDQIADEDTAETSDESIKDFIARDTVDQKFQPRKALVYICLSFLALKVFTSRRGRLLIRF